MRMHGESNDAVITVDRLRALLSYDPDTGVFVRLISTSNRVKVDSIAGNLNTTGYWRISLDGRSYLAHRLAWLYTYGVWPNEEIDHLNGDRSDNRISNLREATSAQNKQNRRHPQSKTSGFLGVTWDKAKQRWMARIEVDSKKRFLGYFESPEDAHRVYVCAKTEFHPFSTLQLPSTKP